MSRCFSWLALAAMCVIAAGCSTTPRISSPGTAIPADLKDLDRWQARGRLGVSGPENGGSGSFEWRQRGDVADVQIRGPVGIGGVHLEMRGTGGNPDLTLETSDGLKLQSTAAWDELQNRLGTAVPAGNLRYWMLGLAAPGEHTWHAENENGVTTLEQAGWRIDYQRYSTEPGARVPMRITATSGDARVRIVVDRWQLGQ
ncbi:lipoprotein insertase outer membrane protein LolB [Steroidobacter sp.]|uniref:lipoprotein insertase outer membrane protein LolB n=1 Tax=Steroidobacter sp. TaxID=1978227 RepID=UPI001A548D6F|nr:lipoprotein insertase outer membrane protein LolB [Steroidobacter sp.]MBL8266210.1 outer membrane lipoprotein LolB [Steroidobacter sp.]